MKIAGPRIDHVPAQFMKIEMIPYQELSTHLIYLHSFDNTFHSLPPAASAPSSKLIPWPKEFPHSR